MDLKSEFFRLKVEKSLEKANKLGTHVIWLTLAFSIIFPLQYTVGLVTNWQLHYGEDADVKVVDFDPEEDD